MTTGQFACYSSDIGKTAVSGGAYGVIQSSLVISLTILEI